MAPLLPGIIRTEHTGLNGWGALSPDDPDVSIVAGQRAQRDVGILELVAAISTFVACLGYLLPFTLAAYHKRPWQAILFLAAACLGVFHHGCKLGFRHAGLAVCPQVLGDCPLYLYSWAVQMCLLQVAFLVLGPEDSLLSKELSTTVLIWARAIPALVLALDALLHCFMGGGVDAARSLGFGPEWQHSALVVEALLCFACTAFWFGSRNRRVWAKDVLLRAQFWNRLFHCLAAPGFVVFLVACTAKSTGWQGLYAATHIGIAVAAASALRNVLPGLTEVLDLSPQNPLVVHNLLMSSSAVLIPLLVVVLALDAWSCGQWRWPTLSTASATSLSAVALRIGAPFGAAATAGCLWILSAVSDGPDQQSTPRGTDWPTLAQQLKPMALQMPSWLAICRSIGCHFGYVGCAFGLLAVFLNLEMGSPIQSALHVVCSMAFYVLILVSTILMTVGSRLSGRSAFVRLVFAALQLVLTVTQLILFLFVNQYVPNPYRLHQSTYASAEYANLVLVSLMPMTWQEDVRNLMQSGTTMRQVATPRRTTAAEAHK